MRAVAVTICALLALGGQGTALWAQAKATPVVQCERIPSNPALLTADESALRIGVRGSARPFSYATTPVPEDIVSGSGPIASDGYDGYMVQICDEVLEQMLINRASDATPEFSESQIRVRDVDCLVRERTRLLQDNARREKEELAASFDERIQALRAQIEDASAEASSEIKAQVDELLIEKSDALGRIVVARVDRFDLLEAGEIDLLCDPATITPERVRNFSVSPPLFVTGVGYLQLRGDVAPRQACQKDKALLGFVGSTNAAQRGILTILSEGEWPKLRDDIITALRPSRGEDQQCPKPFGLDGQGGILWAGPDHKEVARRFCNKEITYYVGDLEIIMAHARMHAGCEFSVGVQGSTTDRYGIYANIDYSNTSKALLIGRFFEVLNREIAKTASILDKAYFATFGEAKRSQKLELFYWSLRGTR